MDGCCESLIKYFMFLMNFVFAIVGLVLIVVGGYIQIGAKQYLDFLSDSYLNTPIFIIIVGCVIFVVAFFGCCGAWRENSCMVYTYAVLVAVILICEIGAGIAAFALKGDFKVLIEDKMTKGMMNYQKHNHTGVTNAWDILQTDLTCCGATDYQDWFQYTNDTVPDSCCKTDVLGCGSKPENIPDNINTRGCLVEFEDKFLGNLGLIGGIAFAFAFVQFLGVCLSCCLGKRIKNAGNYV